MNWKGFNFKSASFRGAKYWILESERSSGRHSVIQELLPDEGDYESQGVVYFEDFSPGLDEFSIEGYIVSHKDNNFDYMPERDSLIEALKAKGHATLVHPYYGEVEVNVVGKCSIKESTNEGGIARFSMNFVQHKDLPAPAKSIAADAGVDSTANRTISRANDSLMDKLKLEGSHLASLADSLKEGLQKYVDVVRKIKGTISQLQSEVIGYLSSLISAVDEVIDSPADILDLIQECGQQVLNVIGFGFNTIVVGTYGKYSGIIRGDTTTLDGNNIPEDAGTSTIDNLTTALEFGFSSISYVQEEQISNTKLLFCYNKISIMTLVSKIAIRTNYSSQEKAEEYRDKIKDSMNEILFDIGDLVEIGIDENQLYEAMDDLKNNFIKNFSLKISGISKSINYIIPPDGISALQLAYDKYYDLERADDIFKRNKSIIKNPSFCPGGETLRILND